MKLGTKQIGYSPEPVLDPNVLPPKGFEAAVLVPKPALLVLVDPKPAKSEHAIPFDS